MEKTRAFPLKALVALTAAVLLAHVALLRMSPVILRLNQPQTLRAFTTRSVAFVPAEQAAADRPVAPHSTARETRPKPADVRSSSGDLVPQQPATTEEEAAPDPTPAGTLQDKQDSAADRLASAPRPPRDPASPLGAYAIPGSVRFKYKVDANKFPYSLNAELLWHQNGESYDARLEVSAFGLARVQTSRGQITSQGLAPIRFSDKYRSEVAAHFNREKGKVTFSANTPDVPLLAGAQDRLSVLVQLAAMIAGDPGHYPKATAIAIQTIGPRDADTWLFTVENEETLTLPGGEQATLKLVRKPRQEFDQKLELWLAPALGYLPARIRITEPNGDYIDQKWLATEAQI